MLWVLGFGMMGKRIGCESDERSLEQQEDHGRKRGATERMEMED
jgi:hypothetical protein